MAAPSARHPAPGETSLAARREALRGLRHVLDDGVALDSHLENAPGFRKLSPRDRAFARQLMATTLRRLGQIDAILDTCLSRRLPGRAKTSQHLLRLGTAQLLFLDVPPHAAVDTTVRLTKEEGQRPFSALVNGVLRRIDRERAELLGGPADLERHPHLNTPTWLWDAWLDTFGAAGAAAIARAHLNQAPLDLTCRGNAAGWAERLGGEAIGMQTVRLRDHKGPVEGLKGFKAGAWWVQDAAAALPVALLGDIKGKRVLDLCAAPGGKTAQLLAGGARVTALDRSEGRMKRLRANMDRIGFDCEIVIADAGRWSPDAPFDAILLDAPCSATGTIRRHPDLPHLKSRDDVERMVAVQDRLLKRAAGWLAPGGTLVFSTCSLQPEEGPERIAVLLSEDAGIRLDPIAGDEVPPWAAAAIDQGYLKTRPDHLAEHGGVDGFFAARLVRENGRAA